MSSSDSVASSSSCVAVTEQRERAVADEIDRRLVAGDVEQHHLLDELVGGEAVAFVLGRDERAEQVVARVLALPLDHFVRVGDDVVDGVERGERLFAGEDRVERLDHRARPFAELKAIAPFGNAEHLGDHDEGQRERQRRR